MLGSGNVHPKVRLPTVDVKSFDGEPLKYPSFINSFEEIIDKNDNLADV